MVYFRLKKVFSGRINCYIYFSLLACRVSNKSEDIKRENTGKIAEKYSITPETKDGVIMGWTSKGQLEEPLKDIIFKLYADKNKGRYLRFLE